jgi:transposase
MNTLAHPTGCGRLSPTACIGRAAAQRLVGDGEQVVDVPAKLAARVRVLSVGHGRKSDPHDAASVAVAARNAVGCGRSASRTTRRCSTC